MTPVSRRQTRRGGAIKGLAVVLGVLVLLFLYLSWQGGLTLEDLPALFLAIPIWFYIAVLSVGAVFVAALAREGSAASRSASRAASPRADRSAPYRPAKWTSGAPAYASPRDEPKRMVIDFVPVVRAPTAEVAPAATASPEGASFVSASSEEAPAVNAWPTESVPLGKPPRDRVPRAAPHPEPAPISVTAAIPEPYLGPELESGPEGMAAAVEAPLVNEAGPPDTLLGRLMNWLDETSPEAVTKRRSRRSSKKSGR